MAFPQLLVHAYLGLLFCTTREALLSEHDDKHPQEA